MANFFFLSYNGFMSNKGFTLIELLVVIAILAILSSVGLIVYSGAQKSARLAKRVSDLRNISLALELFREDHGLYPKTESWRSECQTGGNIAPDDVIPGLVPKYLSAFPQDPQMDITNNKSCYLYTSNTEGTGYKLLDFQIAEFSSDDYLKQRGIVDPNRDGGSDPCKVDGTSPEAWAFYTYNACGL